MACAIKGVPAEHNQPGSTMLCMQSLESEALPLMKFSLAFTIPHLPLSCKAFALQRLHTVLCYPAGCGSRYCHDDCQQRTY